MLETVLNQIFPSSVFISIYER